ncbi:MAG: hypothetical protein K6T91_03175 [Firmicutes bacterium]|nr:hypothetical protein [Bacillota bacterium]
MLTTLIILATIFSGCAPTTTTTTTATQRERIRRTTTTQARTTTTQATTTTTLPTTTTQAPTTTTTQPASTTTQAPAAQLTLDIVSVTSPVSRGNAVTLVAKTTPGATCSIVVMYKSGPSRAQGLGTKVADANGYVSWTWIVGTRTTLGTWPITVTASMGGKSVSRSTSFTVVE